MALDTNNNLFEAENLGTLIQLTDPIGRFSSASRTASVSSLDDVNDFYKFRINQASNLEIGLSNVSAGSTLELVHNVNNSIFGDVGEVVKLITVNGGGDRFNVEGLASGEYFLRVAKSGVGTANYTLNLNATAGIGREQEPNDFLNQPQDLHVVNGGRLLSGSVTDSSDDFDVYRFRVDTPTRFSSVLLPTGSNADIRLLNEQGEVVSASINANLNTDIVSSDNLAVGDYRLIVNESGGSASNYSLFMGAVPVNRAELSVFIDQVSSNGSFGNETPDFIAKATIDGTTKRTRKIESRNANFDETLTQAVSLNKRFIPIKLSVVDEDNLLQLRDDIADINPTSGIRDLTVNYDTLTGKVTGSGVNAQEGNTITVTGNGDDGKATTLKFKVNYNTFGFGETSFSASTPTILGTSASQTLTGRNLGGILDGAAGHDNLSGMGGNDAIIGGLGNDRMDGGVGDDITYGGAGRDVHIGGAGRNTFVLDLLEGVDVIQDFQNGADQLGLSHGLTYAALTIKQVGRNTLISAGDEQIVTLKGVNVNQISVDDFNSVNFTHFQGMAVPTVL